MLGRAFAPSLHRLGLMLPERLLTRAAMNALARNFDPGFRCCSAPCRDRPSGAASSHWCQCDGEWGPPMWGAREMTAAAFAFCVSDRSRMAETRHGRGSGAAESAARRATPKLFLYPHRV